jgi:transcriptional regulator with XRE-family HTH domain
MIASFVENISWLRRSRNLSQQELADILEIKRTTLSAYEQGKAEPNITTLKKYAEYFEVSIDDMINKPMAKPILPDNSDPKIKVLAITVDNEDRENIEFVPVKASAGYLSSYGDPEYVRDLPKFRLPMLPHGTFRAFEVHGDSMLPIVSGSVIIGQYVETLRDIKLGDTYIFITSHHGILFKRAAHIDKQRILLKSDNPLYHSYDLPLSEVNEIWKTKLYMSYHFPDPNSTLDRIESSIANLQEEVKRMRAN